MDRPCSRTGRAEPWAVAAHDTLRGLEKAPHDHRANWPRGAARRVRLPDLEPRPGGFLSVTAPGSVAQSEPERKASLGFQWGTHSNAVCRDPLDTQPGARLQRAASPCLGAVPAVFPS